MKRQLVVTAAVIERDGSFLIAQRPPDKHMGLKWEFPGGKLEWGEDPRAGLAREIREELAIEIEVGDVLEVVAHVYDELQVVLLVYACTYRSGNVQLLDVQDVRWVSRQELRQYDMAPADWPIVDKLLSRA
ncbi:MAG: (deoxy)nucleoside triphosphate pyrophosphohydrolase [Tumebacillaceae bacterium]